MEILYLLIPMALMLVGLLVWAFWWAIRSGQFDDLEGPAYSILMDDDVQPPASTPAAKPAPAATEPPQQR